MGVLGWDGMRVSARGELRQERAGKNTSIPRRSTPPPHLRPPVPPPPSSLLARRRRAHLGLKCTSSTASFCSLWALVTRSTTCMCPLSLACSQVTESSTKVSSTMRSFALKTSWGVAGSSKRAPLVSPVKAISGIFVFVFDWFFYCVLFC